MKRLFNGDWGRPPRALLVLLVLLGLVLPTPRAADAAQEPWTTLGWLPFVPSSIVSDGVSIYLASAAEQRVVRVPYQGGALLPVESVPWPGGAADRVVLTLGRGGLYATLVADGRTTTYRTEVSQRGFGSSQWRNVDSLSDGVTNWLSSVGVANRVWLLDDHAGSWLHGFTAYGSGEWRTSRFDRAIDLHEDRRGAVLVGTPQYLYVLGGDADPTEATSVQMTAFGPQTPKALPPLAEPLRGISAAIHGSQLYVIGNDADGVVVYRSPMLWNGAFDLWARLISPPPGAPSIAAVAAQGRILIARADGRLDALSVAAVAPGLKRIVWKVDMGHERIIHPGETLVERIPWEYDGPEEITGFESWSYATGRASHLADSEASLAGTHIEAGGGTGKTLVLVITIPKASRRKDYWSVVVLEVRGKPLGSVLRLHHVNPEWRDLTP